MKEDSVEGKAKSRKSKPRGSKKLSRRDADLCDFDGLKAVVDGQIDELRSQFEEYAESTDRQIAKLFAMLLDSSGRSEFAGFSRPGGYSGGEQKQKESVVYFVECIEVKAVKIGVSGNIKGRLSSLQTGCPHKLKLIGFVYGSYEEESILHKFFKKMGYWLTGEWFYYSGDMKDYIDAVVPDRMFVHPEEIPISRCRHIPASVAKDIPKLEIADMYINKALPPTREISLLPEV